jgi:hypothetical protein
MKLELIRCTRFGGWIAAVDEDRIPADPFARVYTNKPNTRKVDPELQKAVAMMVAAPDLAKALQALRTEVMHDCENSSVSATQFAALLDRADEALKKAGVM